MPPYTGDNNNLYKIPNFATTEKPSKIKKAFKNNKICKNISGGTTRHITANSTIYKKPRLILRLNHQISKLGKTTKINE
jgi:hypothetical protein